MKARAHIFVTGRVQGVFFRASTRDIARKLGLTGWVKNLKDGRVEAVFEGEKEDVAKAVSWCHDGPPGAEVTSLESKWGDYLGEFMSFDVIH